jgi:hypothetical protein
MELSRQAAHRLVPRLASNIPSVRASGSITVEKGERKTEKVTFTRAGGMCPRCEGWLVRAHLSRVWRRRSGQADQAVHRKPSVDDVLFG